MTLLLTILVVLGLLVGTELWWRRRAVHDEFSRKFIHITVGSFVAFWPFFLSWRQIIGLSAAFLVVISISKALKLFQAIHSVLRPTWGEVYFALAVGLVAVITQDPWIYMAALLQMSLADGLAAVIGVRYGRQSYLVFGARKSLAGSLTFFVVSLALLAGYVVLAGATLSWAALIGLAALATMLENLAVKGLDNLLVPVLIAVALNTL